MARLDRLTTFVLCGLGGCAGAGIAPGPGSVSQAAQERIAAETFAGRVDGFRRACRVADARPDDFRMQRKAGELAAELLERGDKRVPAGEILRAAAPTLARLDQAPDACMMRLTSARVYEAAGELDPARERFERSARECHQAPAAIDGARLLRQLGRCDDAIALVGAVWPAARPAQFVALMDEVAACSDPVTLRQNLSFVPAEVREDYFNLVAQRERAAAEAARQAAENEREQRAREAADEARSRCESQCSSAVSQCESGCAGSSQCSSRCASLGSTCRAGCQ